MRRVMLSGLIIEMNGLVRDIVKMHDDAFTHTYHNKSCRLAISDDLLKLNKYPDDCRLFTNTLSYNIEENADDKVIELWLKYLVKKYPRVRFTITRIYSDDKKSTKKFTIKKYNYTLYNRFYISLKRVDFDGKYYY